MSVIRSLIYNLRQKKKIKKSFPGLKLEKCVHLKGDLENLKINGEVSIQSGTVLHLGGMKWCNNTGHISIGDESVISHNCVLFGAGPYGIKIGKRFDCGPNAGIFASRTDYSAGLGHHIFAPVIIGDDVIIYSHSVISPGVQIGDNAVIAAGSVVISDVEPNTLVGGVPAKILKKKVRTI